MQEPGFAHDMMDVKVLILFVTARCGYPVSSQEIYELCDWVSYFDVCTALPELVASGHLRQTGEKYEITEKGREQGALTETDIPFTVRKRAENAADRFNRRLRLSSRVATQVVPQEHGDYAVAMTLSDEMGMLMKLELTAPDQRQAARLSRLLEQKAEEIYGLTMTSLLDENEEL